MAAVFSENEFKHKLMFHPNQRWEMGNGDKDNK
jgi:hypothetical protein